MPQGCERTQLVAFENCWRSSGAQTSRTGLTSPTGQTDQRSQIRTSLSYHFTKTFWPLMR